MNIKLNQRPIYNIKVNQTGTLLQPSTPISIKGQLTLNRISEMADFDVVDAVDGATLVYNSSTGSFELTYLDYDYGEY